MIGSIIWMIVLVFIVVNAIQKGGKNQKTVQRVYGEKKAAPGNKNGAVGSAGYGNSQTVPQGKPIAQAGRVPNKQGAKQPRRMEQGAWEYGNTPPTQAELKRRLQEKYNRQDPAHSIILERAIQNNNEERKQEEAAAEAVGRSLDERSQQPLNFRESQGGREVLQQKPQPAETSQILTESELMDQISDILAKGVDTRLSYERDFVAEGMAMISRYQ